MAAITELWLRWKVWLLSALAGAGLGCLFRLMLAADKISSRLDYTTSVVTLAYLCVVPFSMGYLAVRQYLKSSPNPIWYKWIGLPVASVLLMMLFFIAVKWEGAICIIFASPILLVCGLFGGIAARVVWGQLNKRSPGTMSAIALPILLLLVESQVPLPNEIRTVDTEILVHAPVKTVWDNIKSVRTIASSELPGSWVEHIGFPRPIAATLSYEGIGGVRQASFTGGLIFTETVNRWDQENDLRFSIHANTESIPATTLDEHVTIGGQFFDVLDGEYRLEPRADGVLLHLSSHERLSTHMNPYAARWTDAVMRAIQNEILVVIRNRCETAVQR